MDKVYLSPSTQEHNSYKGGGNEEAEMRLVVKEAAKWLKAAGYDVRIGGTVSASANVADANSWGADIYVAVHSNAGGGDGTLGFYFSTSAKGKKLAEKVYAAIAPLSPGKDDGVKTGDKLIEVRGPKAPATLIELAFHDRAAESAWIKANETLIGKALAKGILAYYGKSITPPKPPVTKPPVARKRYEVTAKRLNFRRTADGFILGQLTKGTLVDVIKKDGKWYQVNVVKNGRTGWVHSAYLKVK